MDKVALVLISAALLSLTMWSGEGRAASEPTSAQITPTPATPLWQTLPAPAPLPPFELEGRLSHDGARIWFATFGAGAPVILLHGGDASSDYWGDQVPALLADGHRVIVIDSRGHGRSTRDARPLGYELMESDVVAVMDALNIDQADVVGWSDGAIIGLVMAIEHPRRVSHVFAFGANLDLHGFNPLGALSPILPKVEAALAANYARLSETPNDFGALSKSVLAMQLREPNYAQRDLAEIKGPAIAIVDGAHEEFILRQHTEYMARTIPGAKLIILPDVSHFAPIQDPAGFNAAMIGFLDGPSGAKPAAPAGLVGQGSSEAGSGP
jgi:pimeloyl-ACP methyl ester carboxylesterase